MNEGEALSPPNINVFKVGTFSNVRLVASEGVNLAFVTSILFIASTMALFLSHSEGMHTVPP